MTIASTQLKTSPSGEDGTNQKNYVQVGLLVESSADNLTAHAGGGQTSALQLLNEVNRVTTVATAADSVMLPKSVAGMTVMVINHGANPMQVFGYGTDTIDDVATATGVSHMPNSVVIYICATAGAWYSEGLATGYSASGGGNFQTYSYIDGLTATASGTQSTSIVVTASQAGFSTVASSSACKMPPAKPGMQITIINEGANMLTVFPASATDGGVSGGDKFNAQSQNASLTGGITTTTPVIFFCMTAGTWWTK